MSASIWCTRPARDAAGWRAYSETDLSWLEFLTKLRTTGMPIKMMREYASLRRHGTGAARRKGILVDQRRVVAERNAGLRSCLDILDAKIVNYDQIERKLVSMESEVGSTMEGISA